MRDLLVIVPSRGRPGNARELCQAWADTGAECPLLVAVDDDDPQLAGYTGTPCWMSVGPRRRLGPTLNAISAAWTDEFSVIGFMGDDHRPRTPGWDRQVMAAADEIGTGVIYGNDLVHGPNLPTAAFLTSDLIADLGYMCPPGLTHLYLDDFWKALGQRTTLRYLPDVILEHMHPLVGKAPQDAGYDEVNGLYGTDGKVFEQYMELFFERDLGRLRGRAQAV